MGLFQLEKLSRKPVNLFERFEQKSDMATLYLVADAYRDNQKYVRYLAQKSPNRLLLFTVPADRNEDFDMVKSEFDKIMESLQFLQSGRQNIRKRRTVQGELCWSLV